MPSFCIAPPVNTRAVVPVDRQLFCGEKKSHALLPLSRNFQNRTKNLPRYNEQMLVKTGDGAMENDRVRDLRFFGVNVKTCIGAHTMGRRFHTGKGVVHRASMSVHEQSMFFNSSCRFAVIETACGFNRAPGGACLLCHNPHKCTGFKHLVLRPFCLDEPILNGTFAPSFQPAQSAKERPEVCVVNLLDTRSSDATTLANCAHAMPVRLEVLKQLFKGNIVTATVPLRIPCGLHGLRIWVCKRHWLSFLHGLPSS